MLLFIQQYNLFKKNTAVQVLCFTFHFQLKPKMCNLNLSV